MFGINDSNKNNPQADSSATAAGSAAPDAVNLPSQPPAGSIPSVGSMNSDTTSSSSSSPSLKDVNLERAYMTNDPANNSSSDVPSSSADDTKNGHHDNTPPSVTSLVGNDHEEELIKLKQQALQNLAPLVDHLEQTPEEKFRTTMMLIQASDNADLVQEAYDTANKIPDEKARAQALLDVVNEINYFTQHQQNETGTN